jgi:hypothetical protein
MGMAVDPRHAQFFLRCLSEVVQLELLEISHPNFSTTYRVVRNAVHGVTVTLEDASQRFFAYYPLKISELAARDTLDFSIRVDLGDLGEIIPTEIANVMSAAGALTIYGSDGKLVRPVVKYRTYRSDDLTRPLFDVLTLQIESITMKREGASFEAKAPSLNISRTGELYALERFPMLRGFLT